MMKRVVLIGSGNVAWHIARRLKLSDCTVQVYGRNLYDAVGFAGYLYISDVNQLDKDADYYILCVKDVAVQSVAASLPFRLHQDQMLIHTSGTLPMDILQPFAQQYGVLWPLMSLRKNHEVMHPDSTPYIVTAPGKEASENLAVIADLLTDTWSCADDNQRQKMHLMAVVTSNFTNHLLALAYQYCTGNQIDFNHFNPIIAETVNRIKGIDPATLQTGPAVRADHRTMELHLSLLLPDENLSKLYRDFSESIIKMYAK